MTRLLENNRTLSPRIPRSALRPASLAVGISFALAVSPAIAQPPPPPPESVEVSAATQPATGPAPLQDQPVGLATPDPAGPSLDQVALLLPADLAAEGRRHLDLGRALIDNLDPEDFPRQDADELAMVRAEWLLEAAGQRLYFADFDGARRDLADAVALFDRLDPELLDENFVDPAFTRAIVEGLLSGAPDFGHLSLEDQAWAWLWVGEYWAAWGHPDAGWAATEHAVSLIPAMREQLEADGFDSADEWAWFAPSLVFNASALDDIERGKAMVLELDPPPVFLAEAHACIAAHYAGVGDEPAARAALQDSLDALKQHAEQGGAGDQPPYGSPSSIFTERLLAFALLGDTDGVNGVFDELKPGGLGEQTFGDNLYYDVANLHGARAQAHGQRGETAKAQAALGLALGAAMSDSDMSTYSTIEHGWAAQSVGWSAGAGGLHNHVERYGPTLPHDAARASFHLGVASGLANLGYPGFGPIDGE